MNYGVSGGYGAAAGYSGSSTGAAYGLAQNSAGYAAGPSYSTADSSYRDTRSYEQVSYSAAAMHSSFITENFLAPDRPWTPIVSKLADVKEVMEETYKKLTGQKFPHDSIKVLILPENEFRAIQHGSALSNSKNVAGFSLNRYGRGVSEIYVRQDHKDSLLLTLGHEIGHVLSPTLPNPTDEEAKAHAFSIAWMETIRDNNIGNLQPNIMLNPARNGLHDVAYDFVKYLMKTGATAHDIFKTLANGLTSMIEEA